MPCIDYYEACQRKNRANSWNDCHSRVEAPRQQAQKKICWDFAHALLELAAWLQAGEDRAITAGSRAAGYKKAAVIAYLTFGATVGAFST
jgi:hypothetical protein